MHKVKKVKSSLARRNLSKFLQNRLAIFGLFLLLLLITVSVFAPILSPHDPILAKPANRFLPASSTHWLGTDRLGRDILTRIMFGGRISILIGLGGAIGAQFIGVVLGDSTEWWSPGTLGNVQEPCDTAICMQQGLLDTPMKPVVTGCGCR